MKRRNFLKCAGSFIATSSGISGIAAADPCPPPLVGASNPQCGIPPGSLSDTATSLGPGQSAQFTKNTLQRPEDIQWQVQTIWYDAQRGELQYMGKPASSQSQDHSHYIYSEANDSWSATGTSLFPGFGHIWNVTFDPTNGDYWFRPYNTNSLRWFDRSENTWKETASQTSPALDSGNASFAAMGWHPNLFGPGEPGIFIWAVFRFFAYNLSTQSFSVLSPSNFSSSSAYYDRKNGQALYLPGTDQLICFANDRGNGHPAIIVEAGAGNSNDVVGAGLVSTTSAPPIQVYGGGGTANHGHVVHHPGDANKLLLLDEHGSSRVWVSTDTGASWQLQSYTHPFQAMNNWSAGEYTVGTIAPYGVIVGMTSNSSGGETVLWKPPQ
jgi:hypothetical protein